MLLSFSLASKKAVAGEVPESLSNQGVIDFLQRFAAERDQAVAKHDASRMGKFYAPESTRLVQHASHRTQLMMNLGEDFGGDILEFRSGIRPKTVQIDGVTATATVYEWLRIVWVPNRHDPNFVQHEGDKFKPGLVVKPGPHGEITTEAGIPHTMILDYVSGHWQIRKDGYSGAPDFSPSPDYVKPAKQPLQLNVAPTKGNSGVSLKASPFVVPCPCGTGGAHVYNYQAAANYANQYTYPALPNPVPGSNNDAAYNPWYHDYNPQGGDCANLVSQALFTGGWPQDTTWRYDATNTPNNPNAGTTAWINNWDLHNYAISSGRGQTASDISQLGIGDIINYDWEPDGGFDHVTIMVSAPSPSIPDGLCTGHNYDVRNYHCKYASSNTYAFTSLYSSFN